MIKIITATGETMFIDEHDAEGVAEGLEHAGIAYTFVRDTTDTAAPAAQPVTTQIDWIETRDRPTPRCVSLEQLALEQEVERRRVAAAALTVKEDMLTQIREGFIAEGVDEIVASIRADLIVARHYDPACETPAGSIAFYGRNASICDCLGRYNSAHGEADFLRKYFTDGQRHYPPCNQ